MSTDLLRTVIVDDSSIYRSIITRVLKQIPTVELVGSANNGRLALEVIEKERPDLVLLDVEMPEMDGLEALGVIAKKFAESSVLMVSGVSDARRTLQALSLGAVDFIVKPENNGADALREQLQRGVRVVQAQRRAHAQRQERRTPRPVTRAPVASVAERAARAVGVARVPRLIVVGISTGGPRALETLLPALPGDLCCPVLIVQHMPAGYTESLAQTLNTKSSLDVAEGKDGDVLTPGRALIAPGGRHMEIAASGSGDRSLVVSLNDEPPRNECKPSVDVLIDSVHQKFRGDVLVAILTGMGNDGCAGAVKLRAGGAYCVAQDEASCVVYGMPRSVVEAGCANEVLPLGEIAPRIEAWSLGMVEGATST